MSAARQALCHALLQHIAWIICKCDCETHMAWSFRFRGMLQGKSAQRSAFASQVRRHSSSSTSGSSTMPVREQLRAPINLASLSGCAFP